MTSPISKRLDGVCESATLKLNAAIQAMKARGVDVVNLSAGEPDFNVPEAARDAVTEALRANRSKYTPVAGIPELRAAIAEKTNLQQPSLKRPWKGTDVVVSNGGKQAIYNAMMTLLDPGDEVLVPSPYWLSYPEMAKLAGASASFIHAPISQSFKITPRQLKAALSPRVKMIVFNSPSNPTGAMYSKEEFQALGEVISRDAPRAWVLSDEIYDVIHFGKVPFCSFLEACPDLRDRAVTVNGMSKSAAMTGWRVGWSLAPEEVTQAIVTVQGQSTSGINALAQWASLAALKLPSSAYQPMVETYRRRRDLCLEILGKARKIELFTPEGAFYLFVGIGGYLNPGEDSMGFAERALDAAKVAVVPGTPFGEPTFLRLSFSTDERSLKEGCTRLVDFLNRL